MKSCLVHICGVISLFVFAVRVNGACVRKAFTLTVTNVVKEPFFNETSDVMLKCRIRPLPQIRYLEIAVLKHTNNFNSFNVDFASPYGHRLNSINGVAATYSEDQTYWTITNQNGSLIESIQFLKVDVQEYPGVSHYIPTEGDQILISLTQYRHLEEE